VEPAGTFRCSVCGKEHHGPPLVYDTDAPAHWYGLPPEEREERAELTSDQCAIDGSHFFLRGNLEIPILDPEEKLVWGVCVSVSEESFWRATELWQQEGRESEMPYFGWLSTALPGYPETISMKSRLRTRPVGLRPLVDLLPSEHPLSREQQDGISRDRVREIAETVLHSQS
jgi:hypothetical protein